MCVCVCEYTCACNKTKNHTERTNKATQSQIYMFWWCCRILLLYNVACSLFCNYTMPSHYNHISTKKHYFTYVLTHSQLQQTSLVTLIEDIRLELSQTSSANGKKISDMWNVSPLKIKTAGPRSRRPRPSRSSINPQQIKSVLHIFCFCKKIEDYHDRHWRNHIHPRFLEEGIGTETMTSHKNTFEVCHTS